LATEVETLSRSTLRILLVEDSDLDAELTAAALADAGIEHVIDRVQTPEAFESALDASPDLILSDYVLPHFSGMAALRIARTRRPEVPFIFVSGVLGEELAIESIKGGASDYVLKQRLERIGPAVTRAMAEARTPPVKPASPPPDGDRIGLARQSACIGLFDVDFATQVVYWSQEQEVIFGVAPGQFEGRLDAWFDRIVPDDAARLRDELAAATVDGRTLIDLAYAIVRPDGQRRYVEGSARLVFDSSGALLRMVGVNLDVTARRHAEEKLRRSVDRQQFLADATGLLTSSLTFQDVSQGMCDIAVPRLGDCCFVDGLGDDGRIRQIAWACAAGENRSVLAKAGELLPTSLSADHPVSSAIRTGKSKLIEDVEAELARRPGVSPALRDFVRQSGLHSVLSVPLTVGGQVVGAMTFGMLSTRRPHNTDDAMLAEELANRAAIAVRNARLFQAERHARGEAESANRAKDQFLATVSHELRTPLNAIVGWVQLLRMGVLGQDESWDALAKIQSAADAQKRLIEDILDVSRIIHGKLKLDRQRLDMSMVISSAIDVVRPVAVAKRVSMDCRVPDQPLPVDGDSSRLQQVVTNVLSNAVKFTPSGGRVDLTVEATADQRIRLKVVDTGQGIAADFLPHVFERFRQADGSTTRRYAGLGIGLAIARHVTELHGGEISAASDGPNRGAVFTITLPMAVSRSAMSRPAEPVGVTPRLDGVRIVLVDDDPDGREVIRAVLAAVGADVEARSNAADAFNAVLQHGPSVLLSDIAMPDEDGYSLIRRVRGLDGTVRQPLAIAMTAFAAEEDRRRALAMRFDEHVTKPVDADALIRLIASRVSAGERTGNAGARSVG
jgi:PAS domain S-box-containing protein